MSDKPWLDALSRGEIKHLRQQQSWRSVLSIAVNWGLIAGALAVVAVWPHPLTVIPALFVIGARQLGLAVLMHEASHRTLLTHRRLNDLVGNWLCAYPVLLGIGFYRGYHLQHHARTWTPDDPDLSLATGWPVSPASMTRKVTRDLLGVTGVKRLVGSLRFIVRAAVRARSEAAPATGSFAGGAITRADAVGALVGFVVTNGVLFAVCAVAAHPALYLVWFGAWLTTHSLSTRIRSIAEHALVTDPSTPLGQTRTILANPIERLLIAPNRVNYHLEHHLIMTVPHYKLPEMHRLLRERGALEHACVARGYWSVLRQVVRRPSLDTSPYG